MFCREIKQYLIIINTFIYNLEPSYMSGSPFYLGFRSNEMFEYFEL